MEDVRHTDKQWEWFINRIQGHLSVLKARFANDPKMLELLGIYDKILAGNFEFNWRKGENRVLVEDVIELAIEDNAIPQREPLQYHLISSYPGPLYTLFIERIKQYFQKPGLVIPTTDFELLRETINNLEFLSANQMPHSVEIDGKNGIIIFKLPLQVEIEDRSTGAIPADLWEASMLISGNLDKIFEKIKSITREL